MYQIGDLLWIPAGTLLTRQRVLGNDDLFSNYIKTPTPCLGLFIKHVTRNQCNVSIDGVEWLVETKNIRHNVSEESCCG